MAKRAIGEMSGIVKGFGCRPHDGRRREFGGRRPKASKGGNRAVGARAFGEQAVVADAVESFWQHVDQESADELAGSECHDLLAVATIGAIVRQPRRPTARAV